MAETKYVGMMFSPESIQGMVAGSKTQTRRPVKLPKSAVGHSYHISSQYLVDFVPKWTLARDGIGWKNLPSMKDVPDYVEISAPCKPGDIIYVKEPWLRWKDAFLGDSGDILLSEAPNEPSMLHCRKLPAYSMPKRLAQHFLEVIDVRVERLQDISPADAIAEGVEAMPDGMFKDYSGMVKHGFTWEKKSYQTMWDHVNKDNGKPKWVDNPWVWPLTFRHLPDFKNPFV